MRNTVGSWSWGYSISYFNISYPMKGLSILAEKQTINTQGHSKAHSEFFLLISQRSFPNIISFPLHRNLMRKPGPYSSFPLKETEMFNDLLKIPPVPLKDPWTHISDSTSLPPTLAISPHCEVNPGTQGPGSPGDGTCGQKVIETRCVRSLLWQWLLYAPTYSLSWVSRKEKQSILFLSTERISHVLWPLPRKSMCSHWEENTIHY